MKTVTSNEPEPLIVKHENVIQLPLGLLGFEHIKKYVLFANEKEQPFMWLQMLDAPGQAFLVIQPGLVIPAYAPDISKDDAAFLGLSSPADALLINIVTLRGVSQATVNLKGPIVLNRHTLVGKQVIPLNAVEFNLRHPLPAAA
jgi:flagellar assembly factor FliW